MIIYLIEHGAKVDVQDIKGLTPLHVAAKEGNEFAAKTFVQCPDINVDVSTIQHDTV